VDYDLAFPKWQHRGGALVGKAGFIREVLGRYGFDKPVHMNEGGLHCHETNPSCPGASYYAGQARHVPRLYARGWANGIQTVVWYTLNGPGWREGSLLDESGNPRPAYTALHFFGTTLGGATYQSTLSTGGLEGYAFRRGNQRYYLYWGNDGAVHALPTPAGALAAYTHLGQPIELARTLSIGNDPVYIEITP
jgi:hypothetical protein